MLSSTNPTWKVELPGTGSSSPVIAKQNVFLLCADGSTATRRIVCLSAADGKISWTREYPSSTYSKNRDNSYASSSPTADENRVYVYWATPEEISVLALDHSGKEIWQRKLGAYKSQHGAGTSPVLFNGVLILNNDQDGESSLLALDAASGSTKWQIKRRSDRAAYAAPCVRETRGVDPELIFMSSSHGITGVNPVSGEVNWEFTNAFPFRVVSSPVLADGLIIGTCGEGGIGRRLVAIRPGSKQSEPALVYELKNNIPYVPTPLALNGLLFLWCDNGLVACHRAATGERVWQHKLSDSFYSSPVSANGNLYNISKAGNVYVFAATEKAELKQTMPLGEGSFATAAISDGAIYFRTDAHLYCFKD